MQLPPPPLQSHWVSPDPMFFMWLIMEWEGPLCLPVVDTYSVLQVGSQLQNANVVLSGVILVGLEQVKTIIVLNYRHFQS